MKDDIPPIDVAYTLTPQWMLNIRSFDALEIHPCAVVGHDKHRGGYPRAVRTGRSRCLDGLRPLPHRRHRCFRRFRHRSRGHRSAVRNASAVFSSTTTERPHEFLGYTGVRICPPVVR
jgi:hypothetical protein